MPAEIKQLSPKVLKLLLIKVAKVSLCTTSSMFFASETLMFYVASLVIMQPRLAIKYNLPSFFNNTNTDVSHLQF